MTECSSNLKNGSGEKTSDKHAMTDQHKCTHQFNQVTRGTQTSLTLPSVLPVELEEILTRYKFLNNDGNINEPTHCTSSPLTQSPHMAPKRYARIASIISNTSGRHCWLLYIGNYVKNNITT